MSPTERPDERLKRKNLADSQENANPRISRQQSGPNDYYAPFFDIVIYSAQSDQSEEALLADGVVSVHEARKNPVAGASTVRFTTKAGDTVFSPDPKADGLRNFRSHLTVLAVAAGVYKATLTLQPPYEDALSIMNNQAIRLGSVMELQWGYMSTGGGNDEPLLSDKGFFTIVDPTVSFGKTTTIQITGYDLLSNKLSGVDGRKVWPRSKYKADIDIVRELADKFRWKVSVDFLRKDKSSIMRPPKGTQPKDLTQTESNFNFLRSVLRKNNASYVTDGDTMILFDIAARATEPPKYTFAWYRQPTEETDLPLISFTGNSIIALFQSIGSRGIYSVEHDTDDNSVKVFRSEDSAGSEADHPKIGVQTSTIEVVPYVDIAETEDGSAGLILTRPTNEAQANENYAEDADTKLQRNSNYNAEAVIPGHPKILPLENIRADKALGTFAGVYRVMQVTHEVGQGYLTKLKLLRVSKKDQTSAKLYPSHVDTGTAPTLAEASRQDPRTGPQ